MRCHACDGRTHGRTDEQWKVEQYSVWAESAIFSKSHPHNNWCHWHNRLLSRVSSSTECPQRWPKQSTFQRPKCNCTCRSCWGKWKRSCCWASSRCGAKIRRRHCRTQISKCRFGTSGFQRLYKTGWLGPRCRCRWRRSSLDDKVSQLIKTKQCDITLRHDLGLLFLALGSVGRAWLEAELLITIAILYILYVVTVTRALLHVDATVPKEIFPVTPKTRMRLEYLQKFHIKIYLQKSGRPSRCSTRK